MKICSLYGAGFFYIPGTDICLKVGGYVRFQQNWADGGNNTSNGPHTGPGGRDDRLDSQDWITRSRVTVTFDTRQQTAYGTLRTYTLLGYSQDAPAAAGIYATRGFIQIAGFTFGKAVSYFDFFPRAAVAYHAGLILAQDTGDAGQILAAYTAQFGGGVSATISVEQSIRAATVFSAAGAYTLGAAPVGNNLGQGGTAGVTGNPDIVANIRWDGTWGAFQLAGVLHDSSGGYYGTTEGLHPSNKWGYAISPALRINTPMIGAGDYLVVSYSYTQGAVRYAASGNPAAGFLIWRGGTLGYGHFEDGIFGTVGGALTGVEQTTAWSVAAAYEHFWTPALQTSIYGSYVEIKHNANAITLICAAGSASTFPTAATCNPDWSAWNIGSRTQWNVVRGLYVGLDVIYTKLNTALPNAAGTLATTAAQGAKPATGAGTPYTVSDQSAWAVAFRVHRDWVP